MGKISIDEPRYRLELALRPAEPPTVEEVLEHVSKHGVLHGPVDWAFPAWIIYVEYATQRIAETFPLIEEERKQLLDFRDTMRRLLLEAWRQARAKLASIYNAIANNTYRIEGNRLYAPDRTWMLINKTMHVTYYISAKTYFPDILKLPLEELQLLQIGWRASDEKVENGFAGMKSSRPWQILAWAASRPGKLIIKGLTVNLVKDGISILPNVNSSWPVKDSKEEAIKKALSHPLSLLTMWLGDGVKSARAVQRRYAIVEIASRIPLSNQKTSRHTYIVGRRDLLFDMLNIASKYGYLLETLASDKWMFLKTLVNALQKSRPPPVKIRIGNAIFGLRLLSSKSGCGVYAVFRTRSKEIADSVVAILQELNIRNNMLFDGRYYAIFVATTELRRIAKEELKHFLELRRNKPCARRLLNSL